MGLFRVAGRLASLLFLLPLAGCGQGDSAGQVDGVRILASPSAFPFVSALADDFNRTFPERQRLLVESLPLASGWKDLESGNTAAVAQFGVPSEDRWTVSLGWAGVAIIVHPENPVTGVSDAQVKAVFAGAIRDWSELGGTGAEIHPYTMDSGSDLYRRLTVMLLGGGSFASSATAVPAPWAMEEAVRGDPAGIGLLACAGPMDGVRALRVNGERPSYETVFNGRYPYRVPILLTASKAPAGVLAEFTGWAQTIAGQTVLLNICSSGDA